MVIERLTMTDERIEFLCKDLKEWALLENSFTLAGFARRQGKTRTWIYRIAEDYPQFGHALEEAREILTERFVNGLMTGLYASFGEKYLPVHDKEYKELLKWKAEISAKNDQQDEDKTINVIRES